MLMLLGASCFAQTPARNCGTMEYYEMRKKADPSVEKRMHENELFTQEWIKNHATKTSPAISFPAMEGFVPTGNESTDRINYANAKAVYRSKHPRSQNLNSGLNAAAAKKARATKSKTNSMITR